MGGGLKVGFPKDQPKMGGFRNKDIVKTIILRNLLGHPFSEVVQHFPGMLLS